MVFAVAFSKYLVSLDSICFITSHTVGTIENVCPSFPSAIYRATIELAGGLKGRISFTEVYSGHYVASCWSMRRFLTDSHNSQMYWMGPWWCWLFTRWTLHTLGSWLVAPWEETRLLQTQRRKTGRCLAHRKYRLVDGYLIHDGVCLWFSVAFTRRTYIIKYPALCIPCRWILRPKPRITRHIHCILCAKFAPRLPNGPVKWVWSLWWLPPWTSRYNSFEDMPIIWIRNFDPSHTNSLYYRPHTLPHDVS